MTNLPNEFENDNEPSGYNNDSGTSDEMSNADEISSTAENNNLPSDDVKYEETSFKGDFNDMIPMSYTSHHHSSSSSSSHHGHHSHHYGHHGHHSHKRVSKKKKILLIILSVILALVIILVSVAAVLIHNGKLSLFKDYDSIKMSTASGADATATDDGKTVVYNGTKYIFNENVTSILFMGIDKKNINNTQEMGNNGQADAIFILAINTDTGRSTIIPIVRDTMTDIDLYSVDGVYVSSKKSQLCLAYAYGDGGALSCQNTVKAVSRLFYGLPINSYAAIDLNAVEILTDKIGGVTVSSLDDIVLSGNKVYKNQSVTLSGKSAVDYIQKRDDVELNASINRLSRQQQFMSAFCQKAMTATKKDITTPVKLYNSVNDYMITNIDISKVSYLASRAVAGTDFSIAFEKTTGQMTMGEKYAEYNIDYKSVYDTIIKVFYKPAA